MAELKRIDPIISAKLGKYSDEVQQQVEIATKYESYIEREQKLAEKILSLDDYKIRPDFDYDRVKSLSSEAKEKLKRSSPKQLVSFRGSAEFRLRMSRYLLSIWVNDEREK